MYCHCTDITFFINIGSGVGLVDSKKITKGTQITVRISVEDKQTINSLGGSHAYIWQLGFDRWLEKYPSELVKQRENIEKLLLQCNDKIGKCNDTVITKNSNLDDLFQNYVKTGRSTKEIDKQDTSWIKSQIKKYPGLSLQQFLNYLMERSSCQE